MRPRPRSRSRVTRRTCAAGSTTRRVEVGDRLSEQLAATGADVSTAARRDQRGQPRLVAARDDLGARRPGDGARVGRGPPALDAPRSRPCCALCNDARVPVTAAAGRSGVCGASVPVFGGVLLDLTAIDGHRRRRPHVDARRREARHVRRRVRGRAARRARRHVRALAAVDGALDRRRLARVPRRRPALDPLRQDRRHRRRPRRRARRRNPGDHRRCAARRGGSRPHPAVRRLGGNARHHRRRAPPRCTRSRPPRSAPRSPSRRSPTGSTRCAASCSAGPLPRCCASTTRSRPTAAIKPATRHVLLAMDEGDAHIVDASRRDRRRGVRGEPRASTSGSSSAGWGTATTSRRSKRSSAAASWSTRWRSRHRGERCPRCTTQRDRRDPGRRAHDGRVRAPEPLVHRRRVPLLHVCGQAARGRS